MSGPGWRAFAPTLVDRQVPIVVVRQCETIQVTRRRPVRGMGELLRNLLALPGRGSAEVSDGAHPGHRAALVSSTARADILGGLA